MSSTPALKPVDRVDNLVRKTNRFVTSLLHWFSLHWLLVANICIGTLILVPLSAPILMHYGITNLGTFIYKLLRASCHQLPERSFFLFGPQAHYSIEELRLALNGIVPLRFIGNAALGYKVAVCERDTAIYGSMFITGLLFNVFRNAKPLPIKLFIILILPMVIDGTGQLIGLWSSTWLTRVITGGIFGTACILLCYPYLQQGMHDIQAEARILVDELRN